VRHSQNDISEYKWQLHELETALAEANRRQQINDGKELPPGWELVGCRAPSWIKNGAGHIMQIMFRGYEEDGAAFLWFLFGPANRQGHPIVSQGKVCNLSDAIEKVEEALDEVNENDNHSH